MASTYRACTPHPPPPIPSLSLSLSVFLPIVSIFRVLQSQHLKFLLHLKHSHSHFRPSASSWGFITVLLRPLPVLGEVELLSRPSGVEVDVMENKTKEGRTSQSKHPEVCVEVTSPNSCARTKDRQQRCKAVTAVHTLHTLVHITKTLYILAFFIQLCSCWCVFVRVCVLRA